MNTVKQYPGTNEQVSQKIDKLESNETLYEVFESIGTSQTGQVTVYTESTVVMDRYEGGLDAICVKVDSQGIPLDEISEEADGSGIIVSSFDVSGNYVLSGIPASDSAVIYFLRIKDKYKSNIPLDAIVATYTIEYPPIMVEIDHTDSPYSLSDEGTIICNTNEGDILINLPVIAEALSKIYNIKNIGIGTVVVDGDGVETIDDELTQEVGQWENLKSQASSLGWIIL